MADTSTIKPDVTSAPVTDTAPTGGPGPLPATPGAVDKTSPLYIGPTNLASLQKAYTPYQIQQATTKDASGNYSWKPGVDIKNVSVSAPKFTASTPPPVPSTGNLPPSGSSGSTPTDITTPPKPDLSASISAAAQQYQDGLAKSIDDLRAQNEKMLSEQKAAKQTEVDSLTSRLQGLLNGTGTSDARAQAEKAAGLQQKMDTLTKIGQEMADATSALNQGIIYEEGRPVREAIVSGREATLKMQGQATIDALRVKAEFAKENVDLARAYAQNAVDDYKADNLQSINAMNKLLDLDKTDLVKLSDDEKSIVASRISALEDRNKTIETQAQAVFKLATDYPKAFANSKVTFMDTEAQALAKMAPFMAADEKVKYDLDVQQKQADIAYKKAEAIKAAQTTGTGGVGGELSSSIAGLITDMKAAGYNESDIRAGVYARFGKDAKPSDLASITDNILQGTQKPQTEEQKFAEAEASAKLTAMKKGFQRIGEDGKPTATDNAGDIKKAQEKKLISWNGTAWEDTNKNVIPDPSTISYGWLSGLKY